MWKAALAGTTALAIVGSSLVYAQDASGPRRSQADVNARIDMRLGIAKDALELFLKPQKPAASRPAQ